MTPNEYQMMALKTETSMLGNFSEDIGRLLQGLMGLNGEAGEAIDILKKHLYQGHWLDREHLALELGDVAWYLAVSAAALGYSLEDILLKNLEKRKKRFPEGFDVDKSVHRASTDV